MGVAGSLPHRQLRKTQAEFALRALVFTAAQAAQKRAVWAWVAVWPFTAAQAAQKAQECPGKRSAAFTAAQAAQKRQSATQPCATAFTAAQAAQKSERLGNMAWA